MQCKVIFQKEQSMSLVIDRRHFFFVEGVNLIKSKIGYKVCNFRCFDLGIIDSIWLLIIVWFTKKLDDLRSNAASKNLLVIFSPIGQQ